MTTTSRPILMVGGVAMKSASEVFEALASALGNHARRLPDGETGVRSDWIGWQGAVFGKAQGLEAESQRLIPGGTPFTVHRIKPGAAASDIKFGPLGYAAAAAQSYGDFTRLRAAGKLPAGTRFQVSLPTPLAPCVAFLAHSAIAVVWPVYERRMLEEADQIASAIPHRDLAIQWDIAIEPVALETRRAGANIPEFALNISMGTMIDSIARVSNHVPADIELGLHLCYGDRGHKHIIEPKDTSLMVEMSNRLVAAINRPITWIHMPVPRNRDDDAYYAPLKNLKLKAGTEFYLGLIHLTDGIEGTKRRIATAKRFVTNFGVATECGLGRRPPETMPALLTLHRQVAELG
jgi:hypothetical protein